MNSVIKYPNKRHRPKPQRSQKAQAKFRKSYQGSRRWDWSCRNHGSCGYCADNRAFSAKRQAPIEDDDMFGFFEEDQEPEFTYDDPWDLESNEELEDRLEWESRKADWYEYDWYDYEDNCDDD